MRFGRNILVLLLLVLGLTVGLFTTHRLHPVPTFLPGDPLFPIVPESITSIHWSVPGELEGWQPITLERKGAFWYMAEPYSGFRCDTTTISQFLDTIQSFKIANTLNSIPSSEFQKERELTIATPEKQITCAFSEVPKMQVAQMIASCNNTLITVNTETVKQLPTSIRQFWSTSILPIPAAHIASIEWRAPGLPFTKAIKRDTGTWSVTQPFAFDPNDTDVEQALRLLTSPNTIATYLRPVVGETTPAVLPETALAAYGLDEDAAIRVTLRVKGFSDAFQLRFGQPDPTRPECVLCLLDGKQAVVSVPKQMREIFTEEGPFVTNHLNLPILSDLILPESITIRGKTKEHLTILTRREEKWELSAPANLPADPTAVQNLLQLLTSLKGDLIDTLPLNEDTLLYTIQFTHSGSAEPIELKCYQDTEQSRYLVHRTDAQRLFTCAVQDIPEALKNLDTLNQTLLDRTIFSLSDAAVQRIIVEIEQTQRFSIVRDPETQLWQTEFPRGLYTDASVVDAWLKQFSNFKADAILSSQIPDKDSLKSYGLNTPFIKITLDLDGGSNGLRKILLIAPPSTPDTPIPAMVQGRPLIYSLLPQIVELFKQPLAISEP